MKIEKILKDVGSNYEIQLLQDVCMWYNLYKRLQEVIIVNVKTNYLLNRFFSRATINNLLKYNKDEVFERISKEETSHLETIQSVYQELSKTYRNEYFYKNTLFVQKNKDYYF